MCIRDRELATQAIKSVGASPLQCGHWGRWWNLGWNCSFRQRVPGEWFMELTTVSCYWRSSPSSILTPITHSWCGADGTSLSPSNFTCSLSSFMSKILWRGVDAATVITETRTNDQVDGGVTWYFHFHNCCSLKMSFGQYYFDFNFKNRNTWMKLLGSVPISSDRKHLWCNRNLTKLFEL